jgi:hypothetical protein
MASICACRTPCWRGANVLGAPPPPTLAAFIHVVIGITLPFRRQKFQRAWHMGELEWNWR